MLSTSYRLKLEEICNRIVKREEVSLNDVIWCEKLAGANRSAATILRQARRKAANPDMKEGSLDEFLNLMDLGGMGHESKGVGGFNTVDDIVDFFKNGDGMRRD